jgi:hypothetical protein
MRLRIALGLEACYDENASDASDDQLLNKTKEYVCRCMQFAEELEVSHSYAFNVRPVNAAF